MELKSRMINQKSSNIRIGIVGCGKAAELIYVPLLQKISKVKINAAADLRKDRRELISGMLNDCKTYESLNEEMISEIDAAIILTPADYHIPIALELLKNQKYILVEKPLSLNLKGIEGLIELNAKSYPHLAVGFNHRYWLPVNLLKKNISEQNEKVKHAEIIFTSDYSKWNAVSSVNNPLDDLAPHVFDLIRYIFNDEIISISSNTNSVTDYNFNVNTENKVYIKCRTAYSKQSIRTIKVTTEGNHYIIKSSSERIISKNNLRRDVLDFKDKVIRIFLRKDSSLKSSYEAQLKDFLSFDFQHINKLASLSDGIINVKSILAARKSLIENGRAVLLDEIQ